MFTIKKLLISFFIFILIASFLVSSLVNLVQNHQSSAAQKTTLPKTELQVLEGKNRSLHQISEPSLILFFLPQSPNCQKQLKTLTELNQNNSYQIKAVAIGDVKQEELLELKKELGINFDLLIDTTAKLSEQLKISTIPTLAFYHPQKKVEFKEGLYNKEELSHIMQQKLKTE
ncbi:MAG: redoxin domain-containing protein [Halanaerobacter sp.]